ncbi:MAG: DUF6702 family protein [Cyclobacteriaceae bacterium]
MKNLLITSILLCLSLSAITARAHDVRIAVFSIYEKDGRVLCDIKADRVQTLQALDGEVEAGSVTDYLARHLNIAFDGQDAPLTFTRHSLTDHYITLSFELQTVAGSPESVSVFTDFLTDTVEGHENRIILKLNERIRSFRIGKGKTEIEAVYQQ